MFIYVLNLFDIHILLSGVLKHGRKIPILLIYWSFDPLDRVPPCRPSFFNQPWYIIHVNNLGLKC